MNREQKKVLRADLFRHLDGIVTAPTAFALYQKGVLVHLLNEKKTSIKKLSETFSANEGYLNVALRVLASQGWLTHKIVAENDIEVSINDKSRTAFELIALYKDVVDLMELSGRFHRRKFAKEPFLALEKIFKKYQLHYGIDLSEEESIRQIQLQILKHIEGIIVGPTVVALGMGGMFHKYFMEASFMPEEFHADADSFGRLLDIFVFLEWFKKKNGTYSFSAKGLFYAKRASAYGVTVSYIPTFRKVGELIFGDPTILWNTPSNAPEIHVDREMNVWGSGGAHSTYFKKIDEIIIDLFNQPIHEQPKGIVDMGCGNGAFLIHLFDVIEHRTLRGNMLEEHPLFLVGADYNQAALKATRANIIQADIWAKLIWGDIGRPDLLAKDLEDNYGIQLEDLLNVRTFLDHNRIWSETNSASPERQSSSTGAFAFRGKRISNANVEDNLREHLQKWAPYIHKFGLLVIELHTIAPTLTAKNIGRTAATAYDATHGFSDQYIVEIEVFNKMAAEAGIYPVEKHFTKFPNSDLATVSINLLKSDPQNEKPGNQTAFFSCLILFLTLCFCFCTTKEKSLNLPLEEEDHIVLIGNNLCSRMLNFGHFETEVHLRYPDHQLFIRNMCDGGNTPGFRPHSGRFSPWAFPGAERFQTELANFSHSQGHFETPDQWLTRLKADIILAFFGYNESFAGPAGLANFEGELEAFIQHTSIQEYNGTSAPQLVLVSPIAFQNLSDQFDLPDGKKENENLGLYTEAIRKIAAKNQIPFVDVFNPTKAWFSTGQQLTIDGFQLNDEGYQQFAQLLVDRVFGKTKASAEPHRQMVHEAVLEKNWFWHDDFKSPNGVHVFGRRYNPFGPENYPDEIKKKREMTAIRDQAIWKAVQGEKIDLAAADAKTHVLPDVPTNYQIGDYGRGTAKYLYDDEALATLETAPGYQIELFASEKKFPDLANPVQLSFDNKGRLWVAVMPTYPHYRPGDPKPSDKLLILEDTDGDNKADKQTIFVENLHIPAGFEFAPEGVYISQGTNLKLYTDTDGDDKADKIEIVLSGFDDHDTHHVISAFCADPSGAIYMGEGVFLHTNVETPYGPVRATNGGFYRYSPQRKHLERTAQVSIPNPWGIAFDDWGQNIFAETSGPAIRWMMPGSVKSRYGEATEQTPSLISGAHMVRPTSGLEFVSSRHFPDEVQGDLLINNTIGFLGTKQHQTLDDGTGFKLQHRQDLVKGSDPNFRPVDMEFAPDGSLYMVDWHNVLIGHMQHNARDPLRDHVHGRIYRITYPSRPLVEPAEVAGAPITTLLDNLKLPEYRTRYRTRRELRARNTEEVLSALKNWVKQLDQSDSGYEHHLLEALWVSWGLNKIDKDLLQQVLDAKDFRARAAAVKVLRYAGHQIDNQADLLMKAAKDQSGRVRLEALVAASWLDKENGLKIVEEAGKQELDLWMKAAHKTALAHLNGENVKADEAAIRTHLEGTDRAAYIKGKELYEREAYCGTCHQEHGEGLAAAGYPPLREAKWVTESEERLIKLTLKGIYGPMQVMNRDYPGTVPMTPFEGLMTDEEVAAVLTYVRNSFGNRASVIKPEKVKEIRAAIANQKGFYTAEDLLKEHPHKTAGKGLVN